MMLVERSGGTQTLDFNRLIYDGQNLEPLATLNYYGISNSSILGSVYKLRGGGAPPPPIHPKRMAIGAGGAISQNIKRDRQPPSIWDYRRAKLVNIQIVNSSSFEELTGIVAPASPIDFQMYQELGIPFFRYYLEDAESISGSFGNIQSVGSEAGDLANAMSNKTTDGFWSQTPDSCSKCNENTPHRLMRPCGHHLCRPCYEGIPVEQSAVNGVPTLCSHCPVPSCGRNVDRAVAWPYSSDAIVPQQFYSAMPITARNVDRTVGRTFRSAAPPARGD
jgi:hypothetical protein